MSEKEKRVVRALKRLDAMWPKGLMLFAADGRILLVRSKDYNRGSKNMDSTCMLWGSMHIFADGGDPW